jgi:hypothetical protein
VLRWLRAQDPPCPWDELTCSTAASDGHMDVLRWLRAQEPPCPWNQLSCVMAAIGGRLDVLRWLRAQDPPCPWDKAVCRDVAARHADVAAWIDEQASAGGGVAHSLVWCRTLALLSWACLQNTAKRGHT